MVTVVVVVVLVVLVVVVLIIQAAVVLVAKSWPGLLNINWGQYKFGARVNKHKLGASAGKYELGARAAGLGWEPGLAPRSRQMVGAREIQRPQINTEFLKLKVDQSPNKEHFSN